MAKDLLMGIDIGTQSTRAALIDLEGKVAASASTPPNAHMAIGNIVNTPKPKPAYIPIADTSINTPPTRALDRDIAPPAIASKGASKAVMRIS